MLNKSQVFAFLISLSLTLLVGFFIWNNISDFSDNIFRQIEAFAKKIDLKIFQASIPNNPEVKNSVPATSSARFDMVAPPAVENLIINPDKSRQEILDDISEKLDIIKQQAENLVVERDAQQKEKEKEIENKEENNNEIELNTTFYPKILISEVLASGNNDEKQEFVELYNPNSQGVDLTGWYLQRRTKTGSDSTIFAPANLFSGKAITAGSYFLIARQGSQFAGSAEAVVDNPITSDNSFILKNPNNEDSDKLGFGKASDFGISPTQNPEAGKSVGRKVVNGVEQDTGNNLNDFEMQKATPKAQNVAFTLAGGGTGGGPAPEVYSKILISEIKISPIGQRFVELYNPNSAEVDLTGWYLQRKTKTGADYSSFITKNDFSGKKIGANSYFLIAREIEEADILTDLTLTEDNSLVLKNPGGEVSDKLGFGLAQDFEAVSAQNPDEDKSIGRKILSDSTEQDTDNNAEDFELDTPTPKAQNTAYSELPQPTLVSIAITAPATKLIYNVAEFLDISGLEVTGTYSDESTKVETITPADVTGFDSSAPIIGQVLTITIGEQTATYTIDVKEAADTTPPTGTITINDGALYTNSRDINLTISATDDLSGVAEMKIANFSSYHDWEPYATTKSWELPATNGLKTVRIKFKDNAGNETATGIAATITLDTMVPVITLNGDSAINLAVGDSYQELGAAVSDNIDSTCTVVIGGDAVNTSVPATFHITYDAVDLAGNYAVQAVRTVVVND
jgi:hypothetical protein